MCVYLCAWCVYVCVCSHHRMILLFSPTDGEVKISDYHSFKDSPVTEISLAQSSTNQKQNTEPPASRPWEAPICPCNKCLLTASNVPAKEKSWTLAEKVPLPSHNLDGANKQHISSAGC